MITDRVVGPVSICFSASYNYLDKCILLGRLADWPM